jgi:hypothetical protein
MAPRPEDELIGDEDEYEEEYEEEYEDELEEIEEQELAAGTVTACHCCKCGQPRKAITSVLLLEDACRYIGDTGVAVDSVVFKILLVLLLSAAAATL